MAFCPTRCLYCSFASNPISGNKKLVEPYLKALSYEIKEMSKYVKEKNLKIETIYFGGGTPTSINNEEFEELMNLIYNSLIKENPPKEFTVECGRPDSITLEKLKTMKRYNVTRISINPQTMNDKTLKLIGRNHTSKDVIEKFKDFVSDKLVIKHTIHHDKFEMVSVSFRNKEITDFLLTLGFGDNKTFNFVPNFNITWDYIRGVFEGDGYFRWGSTKEINITSACKEHI